MEAAIVPATLEDLGDDEQSPKRLRATSVQTQVHECLSEVLTNSLAPLRQDIHKYHPTEGAWSEQAQALRNRIAISRSGG